MQVCHHIPSVKCSNCWNVGWAYPTQPVINGFKCDLCGSTAIDHTEIQCSMNRSLRGRGASPPNPKLRNTEEKE